MATARLILLRHGKSVWNEQNRFTGWEDSPLAAAGEAEARAAGKLLLAKNILPDAVFSSCLRRAADTLQLVLAEMHLTHLPHTTDWRFNERHYGALQGMNKAEAAKQYGEEQLRQWRRGYAAAPPPLNPAPPASPNGETAPNGESLREVETRIGAAFDEHIAPQLREGKTVLLASHGNALRALIKRLEEKSEDDIIKIEIPTAAPLLYVFDKNLKTGGREELKPAAD